MIKPLVNAQRTRTLLWLLAGLILSFYTLSAWHNATHFLLPSIVEASSSQAPSNAHLDELCLFCQSAQQFHDALPTENFQLSSAITRLKPLTLATVYPLSTPLFSTQARAPPRTI